MHSPAMLAMVPRVTPTKEQFLELIEERQGSLRPLCERLTLPQLGQLNILRTGPSSWHALQSDRPRVDGNSIYNLGTQGIWQVVHHNSPELLPEKEQTRYVYGLTRGNSWLKIQVEFSHVNYFYERGVRVTIGHSTANELIEKGYASALRILTLFQLQIREWLANNRKTREMLELNEREFEDEAKLLQLLVR